MSTIHLMELGPHIKRVLYGTKGSRKLSEPNILTGETNTCEGAPGAGRCCGVLAQLMVARETSKTDHNMRYLHLEAAGSSPRRGRTMIGRGCWVVSPGVGVELV